MGYKAIEKSFELNAQQGRIISLKEVNHNATPSGAITILPSSFRGSCNPYKFLKILKQKSVAGKDSNGSAFHDPA